MKPSFKNLPFLALLQILMGILMMAKGLYQPVAMHAYSAETMRLFSSFEVAILGEVFITLGLVGLLLKQSFLLRKRVEHLECAAPRTSD